MSYSDGYHVIGGGIVGASIAYHLSTRTNAPITLYDRSDPASETTRKSLAFFGFYGDDVQYRMKRYAMRQYNEFMADPRASPRYEACGLLRVATTTDGAHELAHEAATASTGTTDPAASHARYYDPATLRERVSLPFLDVDRLEGSLYRPQVGYTDPVAFAREFLERAEANGVTVADQTRVTGIETTGRCVEAVVTENSRQPTDAVVCAAGPWNGEVCDYVGLELPIRHTLAPVLKLEPADPTPYSLPWVTHEESGFSIRRNADGTVLMTHHPVGGYEAATKYNPDEVPDRVPDDRRAEALETLQRLLPHLADADIVDEWVGIRSATPDGNPVVGWTDVEGFSVAAFNTSGIQLAPATGDIVARQLVDVDPTEYYDGISITRFEEYTDGRVHR